MSNYEEINLNLNSASSREMAYIRKAVKYKNV